MSQKFFVAIDIGFVHEDSRITKHFHAKGWKVWHWHVDIWLLAGVPFDIKPSDIWDDLRALPGLRNLTGLVSDMADPPTYWGSNPPDSWDWMRENWGVVDASGVDQARQAQES